METEQVKDSSFTCWYQAVEQIFLEVQVNCNEQKVTAPQGERQHASRRQWFKKYFCIGQS